MTRRIVETRAMLTHQARPVIKKTHGQFQGVLELSHVELGPRDNGVAGYFRARRQRKQGWRESSA
jgi:hypothetical protein